MIQKLRVCGVVIMGMLIGGVALAATGPTQSPLRITAMYAKHPSDTIYVAFQAGSMPGCYANSGGYLHKSNTFYKEIYSLLLAMAASGGMQAAVLYTQNTPTGNWSDCTIDGIYLLPQ